MEKENTVIEEISVEKMNSEEIEQECEDYQKFKKKFKTDEDI